MKHSRLPDPSFDASLILRPSMITAVNDREKLHGEHRRKDLAGDCASFRTIPRRLRTNFIKDSISDLLSDGENHATSSKASTRKGAPMNRCHHVTLPLLGQQYQKKSMQILRGRSVERQHLTGEMEQLVEVVLPTIPLKQFQA